MSSKPDNPSSREELREQLRQVLVDPARLEFGETKVNLRVGGTTDRLMSLVDTYTARAEQAARIDEILLFSKATADLESNETWRQWAFRVTDYFNARLRQLQANQTKEDVNQSKRSDHENTSSDN